MAPLGSVWYRIKFRLWSWGELSRYIGSAGLELWCPGLVFHWCTILQQASNIDDVLSHHTSFLDNCLKDCMLTNPELLKIFSKLMSVCVMFTNCMQVCTVSPILSCQLLCVLGSQPWWSLLLTWFLSCSQCSRKSFFSHPPTGFMSSNFPPHDFCGCSQNSMHSSFPELESGSCGPNCLSSSILAAEFEMKTVGLARFLFLQRPAEDQPWGLISLGKL